MLNRGCINSTVLPLGRRGIKEWKLSAFQLEMLGKRPPRSTVEDQPPGSVEMSLIYVSIWVPIWIPIEFPLSSHQVPIEFPLGSHLVFIWFSFGSLLILFWFFYTTSQSFSTGRSPNAQFHSTLDCLRRNRHDLLIQRGDPIPKLGRDPVNEMSSVCWFGCNRTICPLMCQPSSSVNLIARSASIGTGPNRPTGESIASWLANLINCWQIKSPLLDQTIAAASTFITTRTIWGWIGDQNWLQTGLPSVPQHFFSEIIISWSVMNEWVDEWMNWISILSIVSFSNWSGSDAGERRWGPLQWNAIKWIANEWCDKMTGQRHHIIK